MIAKVKNAYLVDSSAAPSHWKHATDPETWNGGWNRGIKPGEFIPDRKFHVLQRNKNMPKKCPIGGSGWYPKLTFFKQ